VKTIIEGTEQREEEEEEEEEDGCNTKEKPKRFML